MSFLRTSLIAALVASVAAQDAPRLAALRSSDAQPFALRAAKLLTLEGAPIDDGVILVEDGRIAAIGAAATTALPPGVPCHDLGRRWICPGFVDLHHHVSAGGGDINDMVAPVNMELRLLDAVRPAAARIRDTLNGGVTTTLFIPGSGTNLGGFGVLMKMAFDRPLEELVIRELGAMKVAQGYNPERRSGDLGLTRMGMHEQLTAVLLRGRAYTEAWRAHAAGTGPAPEVDPALEQLRQVFEGKVPVLVHTAGARDCIATARMFQDVFDVPLFLSHGTFNGHWAATALAARRTPVNLGPRMYDLTDDGRVQGIAAGYWFAGCTDLSINTDAPVIAAEELPLQAAMAARLGLPQDAALRAITIVPARQIGLDDRVGSLAPGKDADLLVTAGDPIDPRHPPELVFLEGRLVHSSPEPR